MTEPLKVLRCAQCGEPINESSWNASAFYHDEALDVYTHLNCKADWLEANPMLLCKHCGANQTDVAFIGDYCESNAGDETHEMVTRKAKRDYDDNRAEDYWTRRHETAMETGQ